MTENKQMTRFSSNCAYGWKQGLWLSATLGGGLGLVIVGYFALDGVDGNLTFLMLFLPIILFLAFLLFIAPLCVFVAVLLNHKTVKLKQRCRDPLDRVHIDEVPSTSKSWLTSLDEVAKSCVELESKNERPEERAREGRRERLCFQTVNFIMFVGWLVIVLFIAFGDFGDQTYRGRVFLIFTVPANLIRTVVGMDTSWECEERLYPLRGDPDSLRSTELQFLRHPKTQLLVEESDSLVNPFTDMQSDMMFDSSK